MAKVKVNVSLDADTAERLKKYAAVNHTSVSQAITDWIWKQDFKGEEIKLERPEQKVEKYSFEEMVTFVEHLYAGTPLNQSQLAQVKSWYEMGVTAKDIEDAMKLTVTRTGGRKFPYMSAIIRNWIENGKST